MKHFFIALFSFTSVILFAQEENMTLMSGSRLFSSGFKNASVICCSDSAVPGEITLNLNSNSYIKNNEFYGSYVAGMTYIGSVLQPELKYTITKEVSIAAGWHFNYFFGQEKLNRSMPVIRVTYQPKPAIKIIIGQIYGQTDHLLIEPIYSNDNYYSQNPEYGIQLLTNGRFNTDTWLDWKKFILPGDPVQEQIGAGTHVYTKRRLTKNSQISAHLQAVIYHTGGQVDASDDLIKTRANLAPGFELRIIPEKADLSIIGKAYYVQALDLSQTPQLPYLKGYGLWLSVTGLYKGFFAMAGFWNSEYYFAPMASTLFQSISDLNSWYHNDSRQLFLGKFGYNKSLTHNIKMGIRCETYYDLPEKRNDFSIGLNIMLNPEIFLKNIAK